MVERQKKIDEEGTNITRSLTLLDLKKVIDLCAEEHGDNEVRIDNNIISNLYIRNGLINIERINNG